MTKHSHKPSRIIHPDQTSDRLESKGALRYRMGGIRRTQIYKKRSPKGTASVPGKVVPRKISVQFNYDSLTPLIHTHGSDHSVPSAIEHPLEMSSEWRKAFAHLMHKSLASLIPTYITYTPLPPATECPPRITALARRKIFAHFNLHTLASLIRKCISDHLPSATDYPSGKTLLFPRKVFAQFVCDNIAPIVRTQISGNSFLPPQSESTQAAHKPNVLEDVKVRKTAPKVKMRKVAPKVEIRKVAEEVKIRKRVKVRKRASKVKVRKRASVFPISIWITKDLREVTQKEVIPRKLITHSFIRKTWLPIGELPRDATEVTSEAWGEDEPSPDEFASWLDELQALVSGKILSDTPDVTTKTEFSLSSPHSSPRYPAQPHASSWNPTLTRQSLDHSKMSFSTWSSKAAKRHYATAAVSNN